MSWADAAAILGGLVAGFLSGTIGIGGGLAFVPILTIGFRASQIVAQGTSLAAIVPTAIVGGLTHLREGNVDRAAGLWTGAGGTVGAVLGALVAVHLASTLLERAFGVFVIISAGIMFRRAAERPAEKKEGPPPPAAG